MQSNQSIDPLRVRYSIISNTLKRVTEAYESPNLSVSIILDGNGGQVPDDKGFNHQLVFHPEPDIPTHCVEHFKPFLLDYGNNLYAEKLRLEHLISMIPASEV